MERVIIRSVLLLLIALSYYCFSHASSSTSASPPSPLCPGSGAEPVMLGDTLGFCGYSGVSCCDAAADAVLREQFQAMNISNAACAAFVKAMLCARCNPSATTTEMFKSAQPATTTLPSHGLLCASPSSSSSAHHAHRDTSVCLERIATGSYLTMAAHPDGSGRAFLSTLAGKIWLASVPTHGYRRRGALRVVGDGASPFLDLTHRVHHDVGLGLGLMGVAFHPQFAINGRLFVSYSSDGGGRCSSDAGNGPKACPYQLVVAEFSAKGGGGGDYSKATRADPSEVRRIFSMGLPLKLASYQQHGGQILFRPSPSDDGHLYLITGHGGNETYQFDSSQDERSFLGKIIRFDIDRPTDAKMERPEIFAMGLTNPRGCSFDSKRLSHLYCADVDEQQHERVYLISSKAGNYSTSAKVVVSLVTGHRRLAAGRTPSIVGGLVYRGSADPSLQGRYLFMYRSAAWAGAEVPGSSRRYAAAPLPDITCSGTTPVPCDAGGIGGRVLSLGEDNSKDAFLLATDGVYRLIPPGLCGAPPPPPPQQLLVPGSSTWLLSLVALAFAFYQVYLAIFVAGGQAVTHHNECRCGSIMCCFSVTNNNYAIAEHQA